MNVSNSRVLVKNYLKIKNKLDKELCSFYDESKRAKVINF